MKKVLLVTVIVAIASCASPSGSEAAVEGVGFFKPMPDEKFISGSDDVMDVWMKYIDAHNNQDLEMIKSMSADSIYILGPDGSEINTKEEQASFVRRLVCCCKSKMGCLLGHALYFCS